MKFISQENKRAVRALRGGLWWLYSAAGALWFFSGHYTTFRFSAVLLSSALVAGFFFWFLPRRYLLPGLLIFAAPRLASIVSGHGHNTLWPFFLVLALILWIREPMLRAGWNDFLQWTVLLVLAATLYRWYFIGTSPGVSVPYASFLSLDLALHIGSALLLSSQARLDSRDWMDLATGIALGAALSSGVALLQLLLWHAAPGSFLLERLFAVTARSLEAGRLPGLASNASASAIVLPIGAFFLLLIRSESLKRLYPFLLFLPVFFFQGKTIFLTLCGIALALPFVLRIRRKWLFLIPGPLFLLALLGFVYFFIPSRWEDSWLASSHSRALQWQSVLHLFGESPLIGHGLNSFMVVVRQVEGNFPGLEVDNPPGLLAGVLVDGGIVGIGLLLLFLWLYLKRLPAFLNEEKAQRLIFMLPIMVAPTFLTGQQLLLAEVAALFLIPLGLMLQPGAGHEN